MHVFDELQPIREASRKMVRGLGILDPLPLLGMPFSQCHALIEIERAGSTTARQLAEALRLDPSVASRLVSALEKQGWIRTSDDPTDARKKLVTLTADGLAETARVHEASNGPVIAALKLLAPDERKKALEGLEIYGNALLKASAGKGLVIREVQPEDDLQVSQLIKSVMTEFGVVGPGFSINDPEVLAMSQNYIRPKGAYFVLVRDKQVLGGAGFGQLTGASANVCELRKMYFYPEVRGLGKAQELISLIMSQAKQAGYKTMYLETTSGQLKAISLYERNGFKKLDSPMGDTGHCGCNTFYAKEL